MAESGGTKIGTMFAEIDLDRSKYDAGLERALSDGKSVSIDVEKAWRTMGTRSTEHVDKMRASVVNAYELIRNKSTSTAADIQRAEAAAYAKLERIQQKFYGGTISQIKDVETTAKRATGVFAEMFGSFTAANLATDAIYALGRAMKTVFTDSFNSVEEFRLSSASLGATIATFAKTSGRDMADVYKQSYAYAEQLNLKMEEWNAKTVATGENLRAMVETMAQAGIVVDVNNKKQEEGIIAIANALAIVTKGQEQDKQFRQETRGLLDGEVRFTNRLSVMIDSMVEGPLTKQVEKWRESGTLIENLGIMLTGFSAATKDLEHTWLSVSTTMETVYHRVLRGMFVPVYEDIVNLSREYTLEMLDQESKGSALAEILRTVVYRAWIDIKNIVSLVGDTLSTFEVPLRFMGTVLGLAIDGWGQILAVIEPVYKRITNMVGAMWELVEAAGNYGNMLYMFTTLRFDQAWQAWENTKASWNEAGKKTGNALAVGLLDEVEYKIAEYNKKLKGIEIDPNIKAPEMKVRAGETGWEDYEKTFQTAMKNTIAAKEKELDAYRKLENAKPEIIAAAEAEIQAMRDKAHSKELSKIKALDAEKTRLMREMERRVKEQERSVVAALEEYYGGLDEIQDDVTKAYEKAEEDQKKILERQQKEHEELIESQKEAYADFSDTIQETTSDILKNWDNAWDAMTDIMKNALIQMAAEALTSNIIVPVAMDIGSALGLSWNGISMASMTGATGTSSGFGLPGSTALNWAQTNIPGMGWLGSAIPGTASAMGSAGASAGMLYPGGVSGSVPGSFAGVTWGSALGAGAIGSMGYSMLGGSLGLPQSEYSGITSGIGGAAGFALGGPIGTAIGSAIGGALGGLFGGDDPDPKIKFGSSISAAMFSDEYNYGVNPDDMGNQRDVAEPVIAYFDAYFDAVDDQISISLKEVLNNAEFRADGNLSDYDDDVDAMLAAMTDGVFKDISGSLVAALGLSAGTFNLDFFEGIQAEGQDLFSAFVGFAGLSESFADFENRINEQLNAGVSLESAYGNLKIISGMLDLASTSIASMSSSSTITALETVVSTYDAYISAMQAASATQEELSQIQIAMAQEIGSAITGLNATTIQSGIMSAAKGGSSLTDIMTATINNSLSQTIAGVASESIMSDYVAGLNQQIGDAVTVSMKDGIIDTGELSDLVSSIMDGFDWEGMERSVSAAVESVDAFTAATEDLAEAEANAISNANTLVSNSRSSYISALQNEQDILQTSYNNAVSAYVSGLKSEIAAQTDLARAAQDAVKAFTSLTESITSAKEQAVKDTALLPDEKYAMAGYQLAEAVSLTKSTDAEEIKKGLGLIPGLAHDFLSASIGSKTSIDAYRADSAYVMSILNSSELISQKEAENAKNTLTGIEKQINILESTLDSVQNGTAGTLSLFELERDYITAKNNLDNSWYQDEIDILTNMDATFTTLSEAQAIYFKALIDATNAGSTSADGELTTAFGAVGDSGSLESVYLAAKAEQLMTSLSLGDQSTLASVLQYGIDPTKTITAANVKSAFDQAGLTAQEHYEKYGQYENIPGFATGGTVYSPTVAMVGEAGIEHMTPDSQMKGVKQQLKEIKEVLVMVMNANGDQNKYTKKLWRIFDDAQRGERPIVTEVAE